MIHFIHRGLGGRYSNYIQQSLKRCQGRRPVEIANKRPGRRGYTVAVSHTGEPLTLEELRSLLDRKEVTFYIGDSKGLPEDWVQEADCVRSVATLPVSHEVEASIVAEKIEKLVLG